MAKKKTTSTAPAPASISAAWQRIESWMKEHTPRWKPLKKGATANQIEKAESQLGIALPAQLREWFTCHNGSDEGGFFVTPEGGSFYLLSLSDMVSSWKSWKVVSDSGDFADSTAKPDKGVRGDWWNDAWIPFASNGGGDEWCLDLAPAKGGVVGQVIVAVSDAPRRQRISNSLQDWLIAFARDLEAGKFAYDEDEGGLSQL